MRQMARVARRTRPMIIMAIMRIQRQCVDIHDPFVVLASSPVVLLSPFPELDDVAAALADGVTVDGATTITVVIPDVIVEGVIGALLAGTVLVTIPAVVVPCAAAAAQKP